MVPKSRDLYGDIHGVLDENFLLIFRQLQGREITHFPVVVHFPVAYVSTVNIDLLVFQFLSTPAKYQ